jgi:hypothetical protein
MRSLLCMVLVTCATVALPFPVAAVAAAPRPVLLLAGPRGTLLVVTESSIEERDPTTGKTLVTVPNGPGTPVAVTRSPTRVYVLFALAQSHRLVELDEELKTLASVTTAGEMSTHYPTVEPGRDGVRVGYVHRCPQDEKGCVVYETHRLSDLSVFAVRKAKYHDVIRLQRPGPRIPRDQGDDDLAPGVPAPVLDGPQFGLVTSDGPVDCDPALVGQTLFVLSRPCCLEVVDCKLP